MLLALLGRSQLAGREILVKLVVTSYRDTTLASQSKVGLGRWADGLTRPLVGGDRERFLPDLSSSDDICRLSVGHVG